MLQHEVAFQTDIGHTHHVNQDAGGAWTWARDDGTPVSLAVVADGVSSGRTSERASRMVVDILAERVEASLTRPELTLDELREVLIDAATAAGHAVAARPHESLRTADATTLAAVACIADRGTGVWCGDSRVYLLGNEARALTSDHSWAEGVVRSGLMSTEEAARDPRARMITRWLGPPELRDAGIEQFGFRLVPGDVALACSDGLYLHFEPPRGRPDELGDLVRAASSLQDALNTMITLGLRRGGNDNITAAAIACLARD
ncbi:MAG TPA: protein phosphatase 2C domain-containing protein [Chloroflexota bacterium]|nr:protein phosphatase 2C domain-containing protein [Chloroflexota bacterium]